jgi:hypothetical protein
MYKFVFNRVNYKYLFIFLIFVSGHFLFSLPMVRRYFPHPLDKAVHFVALFFTPFLISLVRPFSILVLFLVSSLLGGVEELVQNYQPGRSPELADWLAGSVGVVAACIIIGMWRWWVSVPRSHLF